MVSNDTIDSNLFVELLIVLENLMPIAISYRLDHTIKMRKIIRNFEIDTFDSYNNGNVIFSHNDGIYSFLGISRTIRIMLTIDISVRFCTVMMKVNTTSLSQSYRNN